MKKYNGDLKIGMRVRLYNKSNELLSKGTVTHIKNKNTGSVTRDDGIKGAGHNNQWLIRKALSGYWGGSIDLGYCELLPINWRERLAK